MPGRRTILPPAMFTLVLIAASASQAIGAPRADDDCLAKPNGPAPEGQHWYYRIDHANKRQCWRLAEEGLPVRKAAPQTEEEPESEPAPPPRSRAPQPAAPPAPAPAPAAAAPAPAVNAFAAPPSVPWPDVSKLPAFAPVTPQAQAAPQTASADDAAPVAASTDPQPATEESPAGNLAAERPQRPATEKSAEKSPQQLPGIEHSFILLIVMFGLLAVTGPIIHFTHRQRQREVVAYKPPRWAPVLPLNETTERVRVKQHAPDPAIGKRPARRVALQTDQPAWRPAPELIPGPVPTPVPRQIPRPAPPPPERPAPVPSSPPLNLNDELRYTLQQLVDRIQAIHPIAPDVAQGGTRRADIGMMKKAR